jgi:hypothetical protein
MKRREAAHLGDCCYEQSEAVGRSKLSVRTAERQGFTSESSLDLVASAGRDGWIGIINPFTKVANKPSQTFF